MIISYTECILDYTSGEIGLAPKKASTLSSDIWQSYRRIYPVPYVHWILIPSIFTQLNKIKCI